MYATLQDVQLALSLLTAADYGSLLKIARAYKGGSAYQHDPWDLVCEACHTALRAAGGQGGRRWPRNVPFMAYLANTIRGTASDARGAARRHATQSILLTSAAGDEASDVLESLGLGTASTEDTCLEEEELRLVRAWEEAVRAKVLAHFAADEDVLRVIRGIEEGLSARKIQAEAGMSKTRYESAHRRWRRGLDRLFAGRQAA
jgi:DNA-directed RNA polymerase specialized sigma24 family protein